MLQVYDTLLQINRWSTKKWSSVAFREAGDGKLFLKCTPCNPPLYGPRCHNQRQTHHLINNNEFKEIFRERHFKMKSVVDVGLHLKACSIQ